MDPTPRTPGTVGDPFHDVAAFSRSTGTALRPYQEECVRAILESTARRDGKIFTVMFARQMGKNETSAHLEAYLMALHAQVGGSVVKAAPSFKPQVINSIMRLKRTLDASPLTRGRWHSMFGYMVGLGEAHTTFLSADPSANVVGATASVLLEIDEAQDVDPEKYEREFRPMASSTNATTVLYGTAWNEVSLLEQQRQLNLDEERGTGERLHFEYPWDVLGALQPSYGAFVRREIARLGVDHPTIQTQYLLRPMADAGFLFRSEQRARMDGTHARRRTPERGDVLVAGIDLAGEDEESARARLLGHVPRRDSTVVTIGRAIRNGQGRVELEIVEHVWWTGKDHTWQYDRLLDLWSRWEFARVAVDASGMGAGIASFLASRHGKRVDRVVFTAPLKSALAYSMLEMANTGFVRMYRQDGSDEWREFWTEISACRYSTRSQEQLAWGVPPSQGHDDFVSSFALCCKAARDVAPNPAGGLVRATQYEADSKW
jgi:hypothetical protein